jgi:hypothetical protein
MSKEAGKSTPLNYEAFLDAVFEVDLDTDLCVEVLLDAVRSDGDVVAEHHWDSGGAGGGAGVVTVYEYGQHYFSFNDVGCYGPFAEFERACNKVDIYTITDATTSIIIKSKETFDPVVGAFTVMQKFSKKPYQGGGRMSR